MKNLRNFNKQFLKTIHNLFEQEFK